MKRKPLFWVRSSKRDLKKFPADVQDVMGKALNKAQWGGKSDHAKPLKLSKHPGASILEIVDDYDGDTYRAVYTVRFPKAIYVLHCFQKKSKKGIATTKADLDLIESRFAEAKNEYEDWIKEIEKDSEKDSEKDNEKKK